METSDPIGRKKRTFPSFPFSNKPGTLVKLSCFMLFGAIFIGYFFSQYWLPPAHADTMVKVRGNLPPLLKTSHVVSPVDGNTQLEITIGLHLRNADGLARYTEEISRADKGMKRTLSPQQIMEAYAPLPASQQAVTDYMQHIGFQTTKTFKYHTVTAFKGTVAQAEQAFNVQIENYQSTTGQTFYAPSTEPSVPASIAPFIQTIAGLDNAVKFSHGPIKTIGNAASSSGIISTANPCQTPGIVGQVGNPSYYTPSQVATGYNLNTLYNQGFHGEG